MFPSSNLPEAKRCSVRWRESHQNARRFDRPKKPSDHSPTLAVNACRQSTDPFFVGGGTSPTSRSEQTQWQVLGLAHCSERLARGGICVFAPAPAEGSGEEAGREPPRRQCEASDQRKRRRARLPPLPGGQVAPRSSPPSGRGRTRVSPGAVRGVATDAAAKRGSPPPSKTRRVAG